ncbi:hypothetical protein, conserved in Apicomplexan species [Plasmodium ovale curtisi]|uniref:Uncharacterized protein n=1 Tax=Plasmodium ovale curtisi TaxID=864141 RepID=A0A1A8W2K2_PLAOA|nr:hypothetical protein, conserved in Apicomplexan species [Plasmodium ovale curtisi]
MNGLLKKTVQAKICKKIKAFRGKRNKHWVLGKQHGHLSRRLKEANARKNVANITYTSYVGVAPSSYSTDSLLLSFTMSHHASEKESNEETFVEEKKKKKKKKKKKIHPYTIINEVNCSQDELDTSQSPVECNTNLRSGPKNDFLREEANPVASSERCIEEVKLCDYLDALNGSKRESKKVKRKKNRGKNDNDNDDMGIDGRDDGHNDERNDERNDSHYDKQGDIRHYGDREIRCNHGSCNKVDLELVAIPLDSLSKARIGSCPNGCSPNGRTSDGNNEPLNEPPNESPNESPNEPPNVPPNESSNEDLPTGLRHIDDSVEQSNVFSKILYRIKKVIKNRKGDPLTNENTEGDSDMRELTVMESSSSACPHVMGCVAGTSNNTDNCSQFPHPSEVFENGSRGDIIYLTEVNPNDVLDNSILSNRELGIGNGVHSGGRDVHSGGRGVHSGGRGIHSEGSDIHGRGSGMYEVSPFGNRSSRHMGSVRLHSISNGFAQCKDYATYLRDKIKKYWLERVHEANIQLSTPHQSTSRRENTIPNEEEGDDPSCLQVLFFLGLICKFPVLWMIGSILFCVTPNEHKRTKSWCLINTVFAILSIIYFVSTSNFKMTRPTFSVLMGQTGELYEQQGSQQTEQTNVTFHRGTLRSEDNVAHNLVVLEEGKTSRWRGLNGDVVFSCGQGEFLNWKFLTTHKPDSNVLLYVSSGSYMLLNRVQVTIIFGKGSRYPQEHVDVIRTFFQGVKNDMEAVPFEKLTMTDEDIPDHFYGAGLRCEGSDVGIKGGMRTERWYLFWKESDEANSHPGRRDDYVQPTYSIPLPVGEIFYFRNMHKCRVAFLYPRNANLKQKDAPANFTEIRKIIMKPI